MDELRSNRSLELEPITNAENVFVVEVALPRAHQMHWFPVTEVKYTFAEITSVQSGVRPVLIHCAPFARTYSSSTYPAGRSAADAAHAAIIAPQKAIFFIASMLLFSGAHRLRGAQTSPYYSSRWR